MEMNWREKLSQIMSPEPSLSAFFLQHSSMLSVQVSFEVRVLVADQRTR